MSDAKLTKKQKKALEFRSRKGQDPAQVKAEKEEKKKAKEEAQAEEQDAQPKKRKTRRGKKGKGLAAQAGGQGPRFILFIGNLPYDITQQELMAHFKSSNPDRIRVRQDKGIAFLEFYNIHQDIKKKIDVALKQHHSMLKDRKINVELTVGGGGNSETRLDKIREKNDKLAEERKVRIREELRAKRTAATEDKGDEKSATVLVNGLHPSRANMMS